MPRPELLPILDENLDEFAAFLRDNMGGRSAADWRMAFEQDWCTDKPNNGFMLRAASRIVGAIGAIYATRVIRGRSERFCNITSWYVEPSFRSQSLRLATALTAQPDYHFTDFTATKVVADSLRFLKFKPLDAQQVLVPNLPGIRPFYSPSCVIDEIDDILPLLNAERAKVARDHALLPWLRQMALATPNGSVHVVYKPIKQQWPAAAFVLGVNDTAGFTRNLRTFGTHLLLKHRLLTMRFERRFLTRAPVLSIALKRFPRKLFRSDTLRPEDIDNLYSEVAAIDMRTAYL